MSSVTPVQAPVVKAGSHLTLHYRISLADAGTDVISTFGDRPATLQIGVGQDFFCVKSVLPDHIRDFHFRATEREIDSGRHSEKKNDPNRQNDRDAAEDGQNSGNNTHQVAKSSIRPDQGQGRVCGTGLTRFFRMNLLIMKIL